MDEFTKNFWDEKVAWKESGDLDGHHKVIRCNGNHYWVAFEGFAEKNSGPLGMGGSKIRINFTDGPHKGLSVDTNSLWTQGEIPNEYKEVLTDNAEIDWMYHNNWMNKAN